MKKLRWRNILRTALFSNSYIRWVGFGRTRFCGKIFYSDDVVCVDWIKSKVEIRRNLNG